MRAIVMTTFLTLVLGLALPIQARAAAGDYDRGTGYANPRAHGYSFGRHTHRVHRRHYRRYNRRRSGIYFYYAPRYYAPRPRRHYRSYRRSRGGSCGYWRQRCAANWGYGGSNFRGCMRYHRC